MNGPAGEFGDIPDSTLPGQIVVNAENCQEIIVARGCHDPRDPNSRHFPVAIAYDLKTGGDARKMLPDVCEACTAGSPHERILVYPVYDVP
tara:strand:+ start:24540 stop:24812 length:273 start_codon:yes stop_codon:yes gene_type:complete